MPGNPTPAEVYDEMEAMRRRLAEQQKLLDETMAAMDKLRRRVEAIRPARSSSTSPAEPTPVQRPAP